MSDVRNKPTNAAGTSVRHRDQPVRRQSDRNRSIPGITGGSGAAIGVDLTYNSNPRTAPTGV